MEHAQTYSSVPKLRLFNLSTQFLILLVAAFALSSCKPKPIDNPESLDPIYADLMNLNAGAVGKAEAQKKKIADLEKEIEEMDSRDPDKKRTLIEKQNLERGLKLIEQDALYYEVRATQRRQYAKQAYLKAFREERTWPDPAEFVEYQERKKLNQSSRDWGERVPKLKGYNKPDPDAKPEKKAEEPKPEGGGH